jgi:putative membrane protein
MKPNGLIGILTGVFIMSAVHALGVSSEDQKVLGELHKANQMEIQMGTLAKEKGSSQVIKDFGEVIVRDHKAADEKVRELMDDRGASLSDAKSSPDRLSTNEKRAMAELSVKSNALFDQAFGEAMVKNHERDISRLRGSQASLADPRVRDLVKAILPILEKHLEVARHLF